MTTTPQQNHAWYMRNRLEVLQRSGERYQEDKEKPNFRGRRCKDAKKWYLKNPQKVKAKSEIYTLWKKGAIDKHIPCAICGKEAYCCHHFDYSLPLCVVHLCRDCHRQLHSDDTLNKEIKEVYIYANICVKRN